MYLLKSKKGQIQNYMVIVIFLFIFGITSMLATVVWLGFITAFTDAGIYTGIVATAGSAVLGALRLYDSIIGLMMIVLMTH